MSGGAETELTEDRLTLTLPPPLVARIQALLDNPELGFSSFEHFLLTAVRSFIGFRERQLENLRRDL